MISVVGRFLEHGRIYYFHTGGQDEYFIGSADCMKRNLESRVEVVVPIDDPLLRKELRAVLDVQLSARCGAWEMQADGQYVRRVCGDGDKTSQQALIERVAERQQEATHLQKRRPKGMRRRVQSPPQPPV